jgi:hypothetical protein
MGSAELAGVVPQALTKKQFSYARGSRTLKEPDLWGTKIHQFVLYRKISTKHDREASGYLEMIRVSAVHLAGWHGP